MIERMAGQSPQTVRPNTRYIVMTANLYYSIATDLTRIIGSCHADCESRSCKLELQRLRDDYSEYAAQMDSDKAQEIDSYETD